MALTTRIKNLAVILTTLICSGAFATGVENQRSQFKEAYALARSGHAHVLKDYQAKLNDYILWPDLVSASYLGRLKKTPGAAINAHLERYPDTSLNKTLRYRHLSELANRREWSAFLSLYDDHYAGQGDTVLDCHASRARLASRTSKDDLNSALTLWMVGKSQPKACDPLFHTLKNAGLLTEKRHGERLRMALANGKTDLARFLARNASPKDAAWVDRWQAMRARPETELARIDRIKSSATRNELYIYGLKRLARRDAARARQMMDTTARSARLERIEQNELEAYVALQAARQGLVQSNDWIARLPAVNDDVAEWGVRAALRRGDWAKVLSGIERMDDTLRGDDTWRYWQARALEALGRGAEAAPIYTALAAERSYHAFLAADRLGHGYQFSHESVPVSPELQASLASNPKIIRARELYFVGLYGPARSEWDAVTAGLETVKKRQAALLADSWGWHASSIKTLARSAGRDDLIRFYPTPYKEEFDQTTRMADIARTWAYGITRSESLFMSDVKSSAGAIGLMQLIPGTGRETARRANLPYRGTETLLDPQSNIRLGVYYLGQMYDRFGDNQVLATAAYNAGPTRVKSWLPEKMDKPADVWIETIPFTETRNYVKRVLFADAIFHWRLTGSERRLAALMPPISADRPGKVARK